MFDAQGNLNNRQRTALSHVAQSWFRSNRVKGFFCAVDEMSFEEGAKALLQSYGVGKLSPNILMMGYKQNWQSCNREELLQYFNTIQYVSAKYTINVKSSISSTKRYYTALYTCFPLMTIANHWIYTFLLRCYVWNKVWILARKLLMKMTMKRKLGTS